MHVPDPKSTDVKKTEEKTICNFCSVTYQ
jgi:hypothetical protein